MDCLPYMLVLGLRGRPHQNCVTFFTSQQVWLPLPINPHSTQTTTESVEKQLYICLNKNN